MDTSPKSSVRRIGRSAVALCLAVPASIAVVAIEHGTAAALLSSTGAPCTIVGTAYNDTLIGTTGRDVICGLGGGDTISGGGGNDILDGGPGNDVLNGGPGNDLLAGGADSDVFDGGTGIDTVTYAGASTSVRADLDGVQDDGRAGENDLIKTSVENLTGGNGNDTLTGNSSANVLSGGNGNDTLVGGKGADTFSGGPGIDTVSYSTVYKPVTADLDGLRDDGLAGEHDLIGTTVENLTGGNANDTLTGNSKANVLSGGNGNDTLAGRAGDDTFSGGAGVDTVTYAAATKPVTANLDGLRNDGPTGEHDLIGRTVENLTGGPRSDHLTGSKQSNVLMGGPGDDSMNGGAGDDTLAGGPGADTMTGGDGIDTVSYAGTTKPVNADLDGVRDDGPAGERDLITTSVENLTGGSGADTLTGDSRNNTLNGGPGSDTLDGGDGIDTVSYAGTTKPVTADLDGVRDDGTAGEGDLIAATVENLTGGAAGDTLTGNTGNNQLTGGAGNDTLNGAAGNDRLAGGTGADVFNGGDGVDTVSYAGTTTPVTADLDGTRDDGAAGEKDLIAVDIENLTGGSAADHLSGDSAANVLSGGGGGDTLEGGLGADVFNGGDGLDVVSYADHDAAVVANLDGVANDGAAGEGDVIGTTVEGLEGGRAADTLTGNGGNNTLDGGAGNDQLNGGAGNDQLTGDAGKDALLGQGGDDTIDGGTGADDNVGGTGSNYCTNDVADTFEQCKFDSIAPKLLSVSIDRTVVSTGLSAQTITVRAHFTDVGFGAGGVNFDFRLNGVEFPAFGGSAIDQACYGPNDPECLESGTAADGIGRAIITVPRYTPPGIYRLSSVQLIDKVGNERMLYASEPVGSATHLPFKVSFAQTDDSSDTTPPAVSNITMTPSSVATGAADQTVVVQLRVRDAGSGLPASDASMASVGVMFSGPDSAGGTPTQVANMTSTPIRACSDPERPIDHGCRVSGNANDGIYRLFVRVPRYSPKGTYVLRTVSANDDANNPTSLTDQSLLAATGHVIQFSQTSLGDTVAPQVTAVSLSPSHFNTSTGDVVVKLQVHVRDNLSGVISGDGNFAGPAGSYRPVTFNSQQSCATVDPNVTPCLLSGTPTNGVLQTPLRLVRGTRAGSWTLLFIQFFDKAGNELNLADQMVAKGWDVQFTNG